MREYNPCIEYPDSIETCFLGKINRDVITGVNLLYDIEENNVGQIIAKLHIWEAGNIY